jgi:hypothetical protein
MVFIVDSRSDSSGSGSRLWAPPKRQQFITLPWNCSIEPHPTVSGLSANRRLGRFHFDSESWMRTVAVCELCAGSVRVLSFGKAPF